MDDRLEAQKVSAGDFDAKKEFLLREHLTIRLDDGPRRAEREWAARFVALSMGFPFRIEIGSPQTAAGSPVLSYSRKADDGVTIQPSGYFDAAAREAKPLEPAPTLAGAPVPFGSNALKRSERSTLIGADVFAAAFHLANRIEELSAHADEHGRFPPENSFLGQSGCIDVPALDLLTTLAADEVQRLYPQLERKSPWPQGDFAVAVTHDIETLTKVKRLGYLKAALLGAAGELRRGRLNNAARRTASGLLRLAVGGGPAWSFAHLRRGESPAPGTYYFFGGSTSPADGQYDLAQGELRSVLADLQGRGCEVGVHFGYDTLDDTDAMRRQVAAVEAAGVGKVAGARHHYLRARFPSVWRAHEEAGLTYDATLGWADEPGFRAGTAFPFQPFDLDQGRTLDLVEVPLAAMDDTFFLEGDERGGDVAGRILEVARKVAATGGVFMLLWHNTMVDPLERPEQSRAYFDAMRRLRELPAWWATVAQIARRWKSYAGSLEVRDD